MKNIRSTIKEKVVNILIGIIVTVGSGLVLLHYQDSYLNKEDNIQAINTEDTSSINEKKIFISETKTTNSEKDELRNKNAKKKWEIGSTNSEYYNFPLVGSFQNKTRAVNFANTIIKAGKRKYPVRIYYAGNNWYTVSLGGFLDRQEAIERVNYAKKEKIADDAFIWNSTYMNIIEY
jgi:hypothetical protein